MKKRKAPSKSSSWYRKKCVERAKLEAKERDEWTCQYCGARKPNVAIHGSHILPEGAFPLMSDEPDNLIALCAEHHVGGSNSRMNRALESWHSHPLKFSEWFNKKYPSVYKQLLVMDLEKRKHVVNWQARYEWWKNK